MQTKTTFDNVKFRKELRNLKENVKLGLSDDNYVFLIIKLIPQIRQYPENIHQILKKKEETPYNKIIDIILKIKNIYDDCLKTDSTNQFSNQINSCDHNIIEINPKSFSNIELVDVTVSSLFQEDYGNNICGHLNEHELDKFIENITKEKDFLSVRSQNVIDFQIIPYLKAGLIKMHELLFEGSFSRFRNCGKKSAIELVEFFILQLQKLKLPQQELKRQNSTIIESPNFNKETINVLFEINRIKLSVRSQNGLNVISENILNNPESIFEYTDENKILTVENVGTKSAKELSSFFIDIINELTILCAADSNEKTENWEFLITLWRFEKTLGLDKNELTKDRNNKIYFLALLEKMITKSIKGRDLNIILEYYSNKNVTLESIAKKHKITKERIRQLILNIKLKLLQIKKNLNDIINENDIYVIKTWEENPKIDISEIIEAEKLTFPASLIDFLITETESTKNKSTHYWKNDVIPKLLNISGLLKMIGDLNTKVDETFTLSLSGLIYNFLIDKTNSDKIDIIKDEIEAIIFKSYGLLTNFDGELVFERNTKEKEYEKIIDIFSTVGRPLHLNELSELSGKTIENLRGTLIKYKSIFINTAFSTYGLKKWEDEGKIKGGTIIELIYQFLNSKPEPSHIYQIYKYVKQFRDTSERSIDGLIKSDTQNRFLKLRAGFYCINGVHDAYEYKVFKSLPGCWHLFLYKNYLGINVNLDQFIKNEQLKYNINELIIKANVEKRIDLEDIKIDDKGMLIFKNYVHSPKRGRPKLTN